MTDMTRLIDRYLDNDLGDDEVAVLFEWVAADAANADLFARQTLLDQHTRELLEDDSIRPRLNDNSDQVRPRRISWRALTVLALIVVVVGKLVVPSLFDSDRQAPAIIAQSVGAYGGDGEAFRLGEELEQGSFKVSRGLVRVDFSSGAQVAVEGPASLEIRDDMHIVVKRGVVTAVIPEPAIGFVIETSAARVVDLGTAFGVSVDATGQTDVCVFDGEVEVNHQEMKLADSSPRRVTQGQAVRATHASSKIDAVAFETARFENTWPINSGVLQATGLMKFVAPGPEFVPGRYEDSERILVFLERSGVVPTADFAVDLVDPGQYQRIHRSKQHPVRAGGRIRSYLLQLDPVGQLERGATDKPRVISQVTFDRTIIGLIASSKNLDATDELLGHPHGDYVKTRRGIEPPRPSDPPDSGRDVVVLSADRRTLSLDLSAGSAVDQIRVVVDELN